MTGCKKEEVQPYIKVENEQLTIDAVTNFESLDYEIDGSKTIFTFKVNGVEGLQQTKLVIEDGKFTKVEHSFYQEDATTISSTIVSTISYNVNDVEMVELPTNVEWTEE